MTTMREVAERAGVSGKTVSRVINDDRYVSDDLRKRVQTAIDELKYVPNMLSQTFRRGRDSAIGVAVPSGADVFFGAVIQAIADEAHSRETAVMITNLGYQPEEEQAAVKALLRRHISGLIIAPISADHRYIRPWQQHTQVVFVDRSPRRVNADDVVHDDVGGARQAVAQLAHAGHRRIAFVGNVLAVETTARRLKGFTTELETRGLDRDAELIAVDQEDALFASRVLDQLLEKDDPATAIFCASSQMSIRLVPELHSRGRTDVGFISFGDFPMADCVRPAISVIDQDPWLLGVTAARRLFQRIDRPNARLKRHTVLPVELRLRESSGPASLFPSLKIG